MPNKLPMKKEENVFSKIGLWFRNLFKKKQIEAQNTEEAKVQKEESKVETTKEKTSEVKRSEENTLENELGVVDLQNEKTAKLTSIQSKMQFIKKIERNPELLEQMDMERLRILNSYYDELIEKAENKLNKLKNNN